MKQTRLPGPIQYYQQKPKDKMIELLLNTAHSEIQRLKLKTESQRAKITELKNSVMKVKEEVDTATEF